MIRNQVALFIVFFLAGFAIPLLSRAGYVPHPDCFNTSGIYQNTDSGIVGDSTRMMDDSVQTALLANTMSFFTGRDHSKALFHFFHSVNQKHFSRYKKRRLYGSLSRIFVRLKLYALAMNCYSKTSVAFHDAPGLPDNAVDDSAKTADQTGLINGNPAADAGSSDSSISLPDPVMNDSAGVQYAKAFQHIESPPMDQEQITTAFRDISNAVAFALIIHIKQPTCGKRSPIAGINNVGHTFVTLIKYNEDGSSVTRSFGFYPEKDNFFSATPIHPQSSSVFKDDTYHDWDEIVGKFISRKRFSKILRLIEKYDGRMYNLNENNCTDFGLHVADIAGIRIKRTSGSWFLGSGNNPANAGQSILEGCFDNMDTGNTAGLFIWPLVTENP